MEYNKEQQRDISITFFKPYKFSVTENLRNYNFSLHNPRKSEIMSVWVWQDDTHPVLDIQLTQLTVSLRHLAGAARHLLHEAGQLHRLTHQGATHSSEMCVSFWG